MEAYTSAEEEAVSSAHGAKIIDIFFCLKCVSHMATLILGPDVRVKSRLFTCTHRNHAQKARYLCMHPFIPLLVRKIEDTMS